MEVLRLLDQLQEDMRGKSMTQKLSIQNEFMDDKTLELDDEKLFALMDILHYAFLYDSSAGEIGFGANNKPFYFNCCNIEGKCLNTALKKCSRCQFVRYCSQDCQRAHWYSSHKESCANFRKGIGSENWYPSFASPNAPDPRFLTNPWPVEGSFNPDIPFPSFLWGANPAVDILNLKSAPKYELYLLFVGSGDLRNIIRTVSELPKCSEPVNFYINEMENMVAVRGFIILYLLLKLKHRAIELVIAIWYSTKLTEKQSYLLNYELTDIQTYATKFSENKSYEMSFGNATLKATFNREQWNLISELVNTELPFDEILDERESVFLSRDRKIHHERYMAKMSPKERHCYQMFVMQGCIVPMDAISTSLNKNPFLFDPFYGYTMTDNVSPLQGWDLDVVQLAGKKHGASEFDLYGCLFFYLGDLLTKFVDKLTTTISFNLTCEPSLKLPSSLGVKFDRIEIENVCDGELDLCLSVFEEYGKTLNKQNKDAVMILLQREWMEQPPMDYVENYLARNSRAAIAIKQRWNIDDYLFTKGCVDYDVHDAFERFMVSYDALANEMGLKRRKVHKIVNKKCGMPIDQSKLANENEFHLKYEIGKVNPLARYVEFESIQ